MRISRRVLLTLLFVFVTMLAPIPSHTQGIPWYTIPLPVPNGFVDASTGNVHLEIPLGSMPQRNGDPIVSKIVYDTTTYPYLFGQWYPQGPGWQTIVGSSHTVLNDGSPGSGQTCTSFGLNNYPNGTVNTWSGFWFKDIHGTLHATPNGYPYETRQVICSDNFGHSFGNSMDITSASLTDQDDLGYSFQISNYNQITSVYAADGTLVLGGTSNGLPVDTNGNVGTPQGSQPNLYSGLPAGLTCGTSTVKTSSGSSATYTGTCTNQNVSNVINGTTYVGAVSLLTSLALPDGTSYSFSYDTGTTGNHYGTLVGVSLPTGGTISLTYNASAISPKATSATFAGGTWNLTYGSSGSQNTTTVLGPLRYDSATQTNVNDKTIFTGLPNGSLLLQTAQYYSGSSTLLKTITYAYDSGLRPATITTTLNDTGQSSQVSFQYFNGLRNFVSQKQETDFTGTVVRTTKTNYTSSNFIKPSSVNVYSGTGSGSPIASTLFTYDEYSANYCKNGVSMLTSFTGAYGHDDANFGASFTARGNVTTVQRLISGTTYSTTHKCYDTLGNVTQMVDANGNPTSYDYSENWADTYCIPSGTVTHSFPTTITDALGHRTEKSFFTCTVLPRGVKDENDIQAGRNGTTYAYSEFGRPVIVNYPDGGQTTSCYSHDSTLPCYTSTLPPFSTVSRLILGSTALNTKTLLDSYGRIAETQITSDPECPSGDKTDFTYDNFGRTLTVSNSYCTTSDPTYGLTTYAYDALGRTASVAAQDGSVSTTTYSGNCTTPTDPAGKARKACSDSLGRLAQVLEDPGSSPHLSYETDYAYDALDNLLCVAQKGTNSGTFTNCASTPASWRPRSFTYDSLSRLTSASNPESGTVSYTYDANGNVLTKTSPAPNQTGTATVTTCFGNWNGTSCDGTGYDALNRMTLKTYSDGTTPQANYVYDVSSSGPLSGANVIGRLRYTSQNSTGSIYNYDAMGRVANSLQCIDVSCNWNSDFSYTYDLLGDLTTYTNKIAQWTNPPVSSITFNQSFDSAGRVTQLTSGWVDGQHPSPLATTDSSVGYWPNGALRKVALGNGLFETAGYNNRLQPCRVNVNSTSSYVLTHCNDSLPSGNVLDFTYGFNWGTSDNGNVASWSATGQQAFNRSFAYDSVNRISQMQETSGSQESCKPSSSPTNPYTLSWTIDPWGNRTNQTPSVGTCSFSQNVNTQNQLFGSPYVYDAAGNMTHDASHSYTYDAENRIIQVDGGATATYVYDPSGRRVQKTMGGTTTSYTYDLAGSVFLETQGSTWETFYLYFAGALHAQYKNGLTSFIHRDHLGSTRLVTALNQSVSDNLDYLPFGEQILGDTTTTHKFTGKERDSESSLDNFGARYNSSNIGRFMSPDPSPMGIAMADPQSWNLYSYVRNRPTRSIDVGGNWATDVHAQMVTFALQAYVSAGELAQLVHRQYVMDSDQSPVHQYMHAMSNGDDPNDTPQVAAEHMWKFIAISIGASNATLTPNGNFTSFSLDSLGDAIHTVEDYTSPMHTSGGMPLPWNGGYWPPTKWGPGLNHVMGEDSPTRDWAALGFAVRLTMAVFLQSGASCENGKRCLTEANFESEARKNIEDFVQSFYFSDGGNWSGREAAADAARQCALGNPAACIK